MLHADRLPRRVAAKAVEAINSVFGRQLALFEFPYNVVLSNELDFEVAHPSGVIADVSILSDGEKMVAAIALRFAMLELFASGCGLMVLDEPTAHLDAERVEKLVDVLTTAAVYSRENSISLIVPTHEKALISAADRVEDLAERSSDG